MTLTEALSIVKSYLFIDGRRSVNKDTGEVFIETPAWLWKVRLASWSRAHRSLGRENPIPSPMPQDHIMFNARPEGPYRRVG